MIRLYEGILENKTPEDASSLAGQIFPETRYSPAAFRLLMSDLQKLVDQFLALEQWTQTPAAVETSMAQAYRHRGLARHFDDALKQAKLTLGRQPLRNSDYYEKNGHLIWEESRFQTASHPEEERYLLALSDNADLLWLTKKLRYLCLHTAYQTRFKASGLLGLLPEMESILEKHDYLKNPAISSWYYCLKMLQSPESPEYFNRFKTEVLTHGPIFQQEELRDLHLFAINYCIRRVHEGHPAFFHDILDFYKDGLSKGYMLENGILSHFTYYNIVAAALQTRDYQWAEHFITEYRNALERGYRDSAYSFNLARLKFAQKAYPEALELLQHSNYHEPLVNMAAKTMALKIYYALHETDVLEAHLEAFIKYIRRKPGLGYHRNHYLQMARYTRKLIYLNRSDKQEMSKLKEKIASDTALAEKEWLLEQF